MSFASFPALKRRPPRSPASEEKWSDAVEKFAATKRPSSDKVMLKGQSFIP